MYFIFSKKFSDSNWKLLGWIFYVSLMATSLWFSWEVKEKFAKQETAIQVYEDKIEAHPTIVINGQFLNSFLCNLSPIFCYEYQKHWNITYTIYKEDGFSVQDKVVLQIGENQLQNSGEKVTLAIIYTAFRDLCYAITTTRKVDEKLTEIKTEFDMGHTEIFFTSAENSYGIVADDWRDGKTYKLSMSSESWLGGIREDITLTVEKNINLKCSEESFYEYVASRLSDKSFESCNETCLMMSLPNVSLPICQNYRYYMFEGIKINCNWKIVDDLIKNITNNDEYLKACSTIQYSGFSHESSISDQGVEIRYKFDLPLKSKVYKEYLIIDSIGLIGAVGGTLGVFIGFSFNNLIICIIDYIQWLMERKLGIMVSRTKVLGMKLLKSLEWIIYFSLMATAILFTWEVIQNYFDRNIGTMQTLEMIESHPTITICPFLEQCESKTSNSPCQGGNYVGDGYCDDDFNNEECNWDGGDCCGDNVNTQWCSNCKCNFDYLDFRLIHFH